MPSFPAFKESETRGRVDLARFRTSGKAENPFIPRIWQAKILYLSNKRYLLIEVPTGAGKSKFLIFAGIKELLKDPTLKMVIAIPKLAIAKSFGTCYLSTGKKTYEWFVGHNFCRNITERKIHQLTDFLQSSDLLPSLHDRISLCSHMALAEVYKRSGAAAFSNTIVVVDEMHHVLCSDIESELTEQEMVESNRLGGMVSGLVRSGGDSIRVWGATATYFRGDRQAILPDDVFEQFKHYFLPLDEHWEDGIDFIESFAFDFVIYKNIFDEVERVLKRSPRSIIFCPGDGHRIPCGLTKAGFLKRIVAICEDLGLPYLDLVTEKGRRQKYKIFFDEQKMKEYAVVLSVRAIDEGADWVDARNVLDLVPSSSLPLRIQRFGRLLRDIPGKKHIKYNYFLPFGMLDIEDPEKRRQNCNELFASWAAGVTIHQLIKPIKILRDKSKKNGGSSGSIDYFAQQVPSPVKREQIKQQVLKDLVVLKSQYGDRRLPKKKVQEHIVEVLKQCGVKKKYREKIALQIAACFRRTVNPGIDIRKLVRAGFDKVWHDEIFDGVLRYATGKCGVNTLKECSDTIKLFRDLSDWLVVAHGLIEEHGKLPTMSWLQGNGYSGLVGCMYKFPEKFKELRFYYNKNPQDWVEIAREICEHNNGKLPPQSSLRSKGYSGLSAAMLKHPDLFEWVEHEYSCSFADEWLIKAEQLVKEHDGQLPNPKWLRDNGYENLVTMMSKYPEKFAHLSQLKLVKTLDDHLLDAEVLAKKHDGVLPSTAWMRKNGYQNLDACIKANRSKFDKFDRNVQRKSAVEWVAKAEVIAKEHGGVLPNTQWLMTNSLSALYAQMRGSPELFAHIPQDRKISRSTDELVRIAEALAKEHGGLPTGKWLCENGYGDMHHRRADRPDSFSHIPLKYKQNALLKN